MKPLVKDLINVGVFTVLYMLVVVVCGQLGALIPIGQIFGPFYIPLLAGIVFMLFLTRVQRFGLVTLMGLLVGLIILATGQPYWTLLIGVVVAPLADFVMRMGDYKRWFNLVVGYVVFSLMLMGTVVPLFFFREAYLERIGQRHDQAWMDSMVALTPSWMFAVMIVMIIAGAVSGAFLGRAMLKKHFVRAQIA